MKNRISLLSIALLLPLLAACGKNEEGRPASAPAKVWSLEVRSAQSLFDDPAARKESQLQRAGTLLLLSEASLTPTQTENCLGAGEERLAVKGICAILAANGNVDLSPATTAVIRREGKRSAAFAAAVALRPALLRGLSFEDALGYLGQLAEQPAWFRTKLLLNWGQENGGLTPSHAAYAADFLKSSRALSPLSVSYVFHLLAEYDENRFRSESSAYCQDGLAGDLQIRCWRLLAAFATNTLANNASKQLARFAPKRRDESYTIFARSFPELAPALSKLYNPEAR